MGTSEHVGVGEPCGEVLRALLERRPLARDEVAVLLGQVGHAVVAAHDGGLGHGALSTDAVYVSWDEGEPFARVFGFAPAIRDYRHVRDDVVGLVRVATEIVGSSPPRGFDLWRERCLHEPLTIRECVAELRALFPLPGAGVGAVVGERDWTARFEVPVARADREEPRSASFDRVWRRQVAVVAFGIAVMLAIAALPTPSIDAPAPARPASPSPAAVAPASAASTIGSTGPDVLAVDRANCPERFVRDPMLAARNRSHRCVRAMLLPRLLDAAATLDDEQRHALKLACAALGDLGCAMRATR